MDHHAAYFFYSPLWALLYFFLRIVLRLGATAPGGLRPNEAQSCGPFL
jgi:hypothetical protein